MSRRYVGLQAGDMNADAVREYSLDLLKQMGLRPRDAQPSSSELLAASVENPAEAWAFCWTCFMKYWEFRTELAETVRAGDPEGLIALDRVWVSRTVYKRLHGARHSVPGCVGSSVASLADYQRGSYRPEHTLRTTAIYICTSVLFCVALKGSFSRAVRRRVCWIT